MLATKTRRQVNYDIPEVGADANGAATMATVALRRETEVRLNLEVWSTGAPEGSKDGAERANQSPEIPPTPPPPTTELSLSSLQVLGDGGSLEELLMGRRRTGPPFQT